MERDTFILAVYCLVVEPSQSLTAHRPIPPGVSAPQLSDAEGITLESCGEYFKLSPDKDIWEYSRTHDDHCLPTLGERPLCGRQAAHVWPLKAAIQQRLTPVSGPASDPIQPIDTLPLPI